MSPGLKSLGFVLGAAIVVSARTAVAAPTEPLTLVNPLQPAADCRYCHQHANAEVHQNDPPYGPMTGWQGSMMANSARDPVFWAAIALAAEDDATHTEECIRCHSPKAFLEGRGNIIAIEQLVSDDVNGVDCEVCHRMTADPETPRGNARYRIDDETINGIVPRHGPWDYADGVPSPQFDGESGEAVHPVTRDPFTGSSELCGTCHDVTTVRERLDDDGVGMGFAFNEQRTYSEWRGSAFANVGSEDFKSCADCHMPALTDVAGCKDYVDRHAHPSGGRRHDLLGANRFMLELLLAEYGASLNEYFFTNSIARLDEFIGTSANLEVTGVPETGVDATVGIEGLAVTVTNETGHKLPSGYSEGRRMWIEVVARYGEAVVWSSGLWDQEQGLDDADPQLRAYEGIAEELATGTRNHLLLNDHWREDTRIPPRGLRPDPQTDPVGDRYVLQQDGTWPHWDTAEYRFEGRDDVVDATPADASDDALTISVRLLYLINTREYVEQITEDNIVNQAGDELVASFEALGWAKPVVLAEWTRTVPLTGLAEPPSAGTSSGVGSGESGDDGIGTSTSDTDASDSSTGPGIRNEDGCSCQADRPGSQGLAWLGLLVLGTLARRRRLYSES